RPPPKPRTPTYNRKRKDDDEWNPEEEEKENSDSDVPRISSPTKRQRPPPKPRTPTYNRKRKDDDEWNVVEYNDNESDSETLDVPRISTPTKRQRPPPKPRTPLNVTSKSRKTIISTRPKPRSLRQTVKPDEINNNKVTRSLRKTDNNKSVEVDVDKSIDVNNNEIIKTRPRRKPAKPVVEINVNESIKSRPRRKLAKSVEVDDNEITRTRSLRQTTKPVDVIENDVANVEVVENEIANVSEYVEVYDNEDTNIPEQTVDHVEADADEVTNIPEQTVDHVEADVDEVTSIPEQIVKSVEVEIDTHKTPRVSTRKRSSSRNKQSNPMPTKRQTRSKGGVNLRERKVKSTRGRPRNARSKKAESLTEQLVDVEEQSEHESQSNIFYQSDQSENISSHNADLSEQESFQPSTASGNTLFETVDHVEADADEVTNIPE
ncbi:9603_t:CDS:1, partial [Scutellospora calospora]